tara:strand:+ start:3069 stop:4010 length:942 start_codon:yes stop_codon:yes gene_type:complete
MVLVGIPLTLLEFGTQRLHYGTFPALSAHDIALNVCLAGAIYSQDRLPADAPLSQRLVPEVGLLGSTALLAQDAATLPFILPLWLLHYHYKDIKPSIAFLKPLVVALFWIVSCFYLPVFERHDWAALLDTHTPLALGASMATFSFVADIPDREEDEDNGIHTPAVLCGDRAEAVAAVAFAVATWVHVHSENYASSDLIYDAICTAVFFRSIARERLLETLVAFAAASGATAALPTPPADVDSDVERAVSLLKSTNDVHARTIEFLVGVLHDLPQFPQPMRHAIVEACTFAMQSGDAIGAALLGVVEDVLRSLI